MPSSTGSFQNMVSRVLNISWVPPLPTLMTLHSSGNILKLLPPGTSESGQESKSHVVFYMFRHTAHMVSALGLYQSRTTFSPLIPSITTSPCPLPLPCSSPRRHSGSPAESTPSAFLVGWPQTNVAEGGLAYDADVRWAAGLAPVQMAAMDELHVHNIVPHTQ